MGSEIDVIVRGEPPEAESDGSIALHRREAKRPENVGWLDRSRCTSSAGGCRERRLQGTEDVLRVVAVEPDVGITRMATNSAAAVNGHGSSPTLQERDECITLTSDPVAFLESFGARKELGGCSHADAKRHRDSAGSQAFLLSAAIDERLYSFMEVAPDVQGSDALRAVHLVSREADEICMYGKVAHVHGAGRLSCVAMEQNAMRRRHFGNPGDFLNCSNFVVHRHDGKD